MDKKGMCAFAAALTMIVGSIIPQQAQAGVKRMSATEMIAFQKPARSTGHVNRSHRNLSRWHRQRASDAARRQRYHRRQILPTTRLYENLPGNSHRIQPPAANDRGRIIPQPPGDLNRVPPGQTTVPLPPGVHRLPPGAPIMRPK